MALIDEYISKISKDAKADKQGGSHHCYLFGQYALIQGAFYDSDLDFVIEQTKRLSLEGVAVVPTVEYRKIKELKNYPNMFFGYALQRRAKGEELHKDSYCTQSSEEYYERINALAIRPQKFFDKFVSDWIKICKSGLQIDASKSSNFFYTPEQIYFIDLCKAKKYDQLEYSFNSAAVALFNGGAYYHFDNHDKHKYILGKLVRAFAGQGEDIEKMKQVSQRHFPDIADFVFNKEANYYEPKITKERK